MTKHQVWKRLNNIANEKGSFSGIYLIEFNNGEHSLAAIGRALEPQSVWIAPCSFHYPSDTNRMAGVDYDNIENISLVQLNNDVSINDILVKKKLENLDLGLNRPIVRRDQMFKEMEIDQQKELMTERFDSYVRMILEKVDFHSEVSLEKGLMKCVEIAQKVILDIEQKVFDIFEE